MGEMANRGKKFLFHKIRLAIIKHVDRESVVSTERV
jgi:hypothetical protein